MKKDEEKYFEVEDQAFSYRFIIDNSEDKFDKSEFEDVYETKIEFFKKVEIKH